MMMASELHWSIVDADREVGCFMQPDVDMENKE